MNSEIIYHIAPIKSVIADLMPECGYIIISLDKQFDYLSNYPNTLLLRFADTEDRMRSDAVSKADIERIITFLEGCRYKDVFISCCCGLSRSPATTAGLLKISGKDDTCIWHSIDFRPNVLVYRTILEYAASNYNDCICEEELKRVLSCTPDEYRMMRKDDHNGG